MISVIIPVYNLERYLCRCIDSVLCSTYTDFELILIDDGSTDASPKICEDYTERDSRVRLLRQENQGVSAARNRGLEVCQGEWIVFVDGDDSIAPEFLALIDQESRHGPDLMLFECALAEKDLVPRNQKESIRYGKEDMLTLVQSTLTLRQLREQGNVDFLSVWARAIHRAAIEKYNLRFSKDLFCGEDAFFNIEYLLRAESCAYIPRAVYVYNIHRDSSSRRFNPRLPDNHELLLHKVKQALEEHGALPALALPYHTYALNMLTSLLFRCVFSPWNPASFRKKREMCRRFRSNEIFRQAMRHNRQCSTWNQWGFLVLFRLRCYRSLSLICRILHLVWGKKGIC